MREIYFVNDEHQQNFKRVLLKWNVGKFDMEYQSACYILALPMIFEKVEEFIGLFEYPVDWVWRYLKWLEEYNENWKEYRDDEDLHPEYDAWIERKPYDLSGSMVELGKFALNMWNGYDDFNLMHCIANLDEENYKVLKTAMNMRIGMFN